MSRKEQRPNRFDTKNPGIGQPRENLDGIPPRFQAHILDLVEDIMNKNSSAYRYIQDVYEREMAANSLFSKPYIMRNALHTRVAYEFDAVPFLFFFFVVTSTIFLLFQGFKIFLLVLRIIF